MPFVKVKNSNSARMVSDLMKGKSSSVLNTSISCVDVRDVAKLLVLGIKRAKNGERYLVVNDLNANFFIDFANILNEEFKGLGYKIPTSKKLYLSVWISSLWNKNLKQFTGQYGKPMKFSNSKVITDFGIEFTDTKTSILEMAHNLIDIGYIPDKRKSNSD